jgi:hypothetical protein
MLIDLDRNSITFGEQKIFCRHRLPRFVALLEAKRQLGLGPANVGEVMTALNCGGRSPRVLAARMADYGDTTFRTLGINNPIVSTRRSTGYWHISADFQPVTVVANRQPLGPQFVLEFLGLSQATSSRQFDIAMDLDSFLAVIEGDKSFTSGHLEKALGTYMWVYNNASALFTRMIALTRAVPTFRRLENFSKMRKYAKVLQSEAVDLADAEIADFCNVTAQISLAWYDYAFDSQFDLAWEKISRLGPNCRRFTSLYIDWLNLRGLILRRQALSASGDERQALVKQSVAELRTAFVDSAILAQPYQIQQTSSNLANILSMFLERGDFETARATDTLRESASLLSISESVRANFQIGNDDIYNPIYILSLFRRHAENEELLRKMLSATIGTNSLSSYGNSIFDDVSGSIEVGSMQQLHLSFEVCYAAIVENEIHLFTKHYDKISSLMEMMTDDVLFPTWVENGIRMIKSKARDARGSDKEWKDAIEWMLSREW